MKALWLALGLALSGGSSAWAALDVGDSAPNFSIPAALGGNVFTFSLAESLAKGPVVLYFFPLAFSEGCSLEAHQFAEATAQFSQTQLRRVEELVAQNFVSKDRLDEARATYDRDTQRVAELKALLATARLAARPDEIRAAEHSVGAAKAALAQAEWKLDQKSVKAPVAGLVQDTYFVSGEWVNANQPVVSLLPPENIKVRFFVEEGRLGAMRIGQKLAVSCDGCAAPVAAEVSFISPQAEFTPPVIYSRQERAKLVFLIEARPAPDDAAKLHPGQPVEVKFVP